MPLTGLHNELDGDEILLLAVYYITTKCSIGNFDPGLTRAHGFVVKRVKKKEKRTQTGLVLCMISYYIAEG